MTIPIANPPRTFEPPVRWLFGRQFVATLKWTLLYTAFGSKLDPRDWMQAEEYEVKVTENEKEFWFDYISDTGDGMTATYSIAYLCQSDLFARDLWREMPPTGEENLSQDAQAGDVTMRRGAFLLVGGDTTYHLSDYASLSTRFMLPFKWAYEDLKNKGRIPADEPRRPLFGIPGNHDYYDMLDGFRRQFRQPIRSEDKNYGSEDMSAPQLMLPGFRRYQESSYVALKLPFNWWLWGLDTEVGQIDERQRKFFAECNDGRPPDKLIVATCAPSTVFGKLADKDDEKCAKALAQLNLSQPFLPDDEKSKTGGGQLEMSDLSGDAKLENGQCRLDVSGDIHHYARYWGPSTNGSRPRPANAKAPLPHAESYASVVSGLGGAFHHPSQTFADEIQEQALYPSEKVSRDEAARRIFKFWTIWDGGSVWLIGFILAFLIYFAIAVPQSSSQDLNNFPPLQKLGVTNRLPITPTVLAAPAVDARSSVEQIGFAGAVAPQADPCAGHREWYFWGECGISPPLNFWFGVLSLAATLIIIASTFVMSRRLFGAHGKHAEVREVGGEKEIVVSRADSEMYSNPNKSLWAIVALTTALAFLGVWMIKPHRAHITPFGSSLLVLISLVWAVAAIVLAVRYSESLFKQAARRVIAGSDWLLPWVLSILAVVCVAVGLWSFGRYNLPALLVSDILFVAVLSAAAILVILMAVVKGGEMQRGPGKLLMFFVGVWHALLQIAVPLLLVKRGTPLVWAIAFALIFVPILLGEWLMKRNSRAGLLITWFIYGALMLSLTYLPFLRPTDTDAAMFMSDRWLGWAGLVPSIIAGLVGAVLCCLWFGWYLAIALAFHGHNNEVGGAARIERFKQMIRFRLTENTLTGYVIAVDDPQKEGHLLKPKLVDVFHLKVKGSG